MGAECEHAGTYVDPITEKIRGFDVRALASVDDCTLRLAVECKNLRPEAPLLIHATPRTDSEAYHSVLKRWTFGGQVFPETFKQSDDDTIYKSGEPVGRATDQPSMLESGQFSSSDTAAFEKWHQAVSSSKELLERTVRQALKRPQLHALVPMLVVPDERLWQVDYDEGGKEIRAPRQVEHATLLLRHTWTVSAHFEVHYDLSHLEVVTISTLAPRVIHLLSDDGLFAGKQAMLQTQ